MKSNYIITIFICDNQINASLLKEIKHDTIK